MNDTLWINLKVLGKLPAFAKLNTFHELFYIETGTFYNPIGIWRLLRGDNRTLALKRINMLIEQAKLVLSLHENTALEINLTNHLYKSIEGVSNLKKTYENDETTIAALDRLLDKIKNLIKDEFIEFKTPENKKNFKHKKIKK